MELEVPWPRLGLNDSESEARQPPDTSVDASNVVTVNPRTGRANGSRRAGMSKVVASGEPVVADEPVRAIGTVTWTQRAYRIEALAQGQTFADWEYTTQPGTAVRRIAADPQGNFWVADQSQTLIRLNADGVETARFTVKTPDTAAKVRALAVDAFGHVYVGITAGGDQKQARLWRFSEDENKDWNEQWEIDLGGWVKALRLHKGQLFVLWEDAANWRSYVQPVVAPESAVPTLLEALVAPFPSTDFDLQQDSSVIVCAREDSRRGRHPKSDTGPTLEAWDALIDLPNFDTRVWAEYAAEDLDPRIYSQGTFVETWDDRHGRARSWGLPTTPINGKFATGPTYVQYGLGGRPALRFQGELQRFINGPTVVASVGNRDASNLALPILYRGAYALFMVVRILRDDFRFPMLGYGPRTALVANRGKSGSTFPHVAGALHFDADCDDGAGPTGRPDVGSYVNKYNAAVITILHNDIRTFGATGRHNLTVRINGKPIDRCTSDEAWGVSSSGYFNKYIYLNAAQDHGAANEWAPIASDWELSHMLVMQRDDFSTSGDFSDPYRECVEHPIYPDEIYNSLSQTELEKIESQLAYYYGIQELLEPTGQTFPHPFRQSEGAAEGSLTQGANDLISEDALVVRYDSSDGSLGGTLTRRSGTGDAVIVNDDDDVYSAGPETDDGNKHAFRKIIASKGTLDADGTGTWGDGLSLSLITYYQPQLAVDDQGNAYWPVLESAGYSMTKEPGAVRIYAPDGTLLIKHEIGLSTARRGAHVAWPTESPVYIDDDFTPTGPNGIARAPAMIVGLSPNSVDGSVKGQSTVQKIELTERETIERSPRNVTYVAVAAGDVRRWDKDLLYDIPGGSGAVETFARYVQTASLFGELFITDGVRKMVYSPRDDKLSTYAATTGEVPEEGFELLVQWNGRLVWGRGSDNPHQWWATAQGDPYDVDFFPIVPTATQAILGTSSRAGGCPDIINALVPITDDVLLFGCDHGLYKLNGDPAQGGYIDELSTVTGMTFGAPWCKTPDGAIIFFGTPYGSLYSLAPGGLPQRISRYTIERRLQAIDFNLFRAELAWDQALEGVRIMLFPINQGAGYARHFFLETKYGGWWEHEVAPDTADLGVRPTAMAVIDGDDPEDRRIVVGCQDGHLRWFDPMALSDDGVPIRSRIRLGPVALGESSIESLLTSVTAVLTNDSTSVGFRVFASPTADLPGSAVASGVLVPGRNNTLRPRARGAYLWLELFDETNEGFWALETLHMDVEAGGLKRVRSA